MIDGMDFLELLTPSPSINSFTLGTIKSGKVQFDGEETPSQKEYRILNKIPLNENDRVLLANVGGTFVILGKNDIEGGNGEKGDKGDKGEQGASGIITGEIKLFAGNVIPTLWHLCDGTILNKSEYPALHGAIGFTYGGNGTTTFALPDLRGRFPIGSSAELEIGTTHNNLTSITLSEENMASHTHTVSNTVENNTNTAIPLSLEIAIPVNTDNPPSNITNIPSIDATLSVNKMKSGTLIPVIYTTNPPTEGTSLKPFTVEKDIAIPNQQITVASTLEATGLGTAIDIAPSNLCINYIIAL